MRQWAVTLQVPNFIVLFGGFSSRISQGVCEILSSPSYALGALAIL